MRSTIVSILMLLVAAVIALFAGQNVQVITVRFLGWSVEASLVIVIVFAAAAGGLLVGIASLWRQLQSGLSHREVAGRMSRLEQTKEELTEENAKLRGQVETLEASVARMSAERRETAARAPDPGKAEEEPSSSGE